MEEDPQQHPATTGSTTHGNTHASVVGSVTQYATSLVGWKPSGRLLAVVPKVHDGALTDMCYLPRDCCHHRNPSGSTVAGAKELSASVTAGSGGGGSGASRGPGGEEWGRLATCGEDGTLRLWAVAGEGPSPLELLITVEVSTRGVGVGHARSVSWDKSGTTLVLGTVGNAVCLVQPGQVQSSAVQ